MSLLAKVKAVPVKGRVLPTVDGEDLEVALALLRGEVTGSQIAATFEKSPGYVTGWAWRILSSALATGNLVVERRKAGGK